MKTGGYGTFYFALTLLISLAISSHQLEAKSINPVKIAISSSPNNLNPFFSTDSNSQNINRLVHISLTDFDSNMQFICKLCESFQESIRDGQHVLSFKLKKDVLFHDGTKVTAHDVYKSWKYFSDDKKIKSVFRFAFKQIVKVNLTSDFEVELVYENFNVENLSNLALLKIIKLKKEDDASLENIIGAGEYVLKKGNDLSIELIPQNEKKEILQFKVVKDETTLALKIVKGEIDLSISDMSPRKISWIDKNVNHVEILKRDSTNYKYISINHKKKKFKDKRLIAALSHLIPREDIIKYKLRGNAVLANSLYSKAFKDLYIETKPNNYNPEAAHKVFEQLGYKKNNKGFWSKNNQLLSLNWIASNGKSSIEMANLIKSYFMKAGVNVNLTFLEWGSFMRNFKTGNFDIVMGQWIGFTGADMMEFAFHSEKVPPKGGNRGFFINSKFDELVDKAKVSLDRKVRNNYYKQALAIAFNNYAYINLWHPKIVWVGKKCLKGIELYPNGNFYGLVNVENRCE